MMPKNRDERLEEILQGLRRGETFAGDADLLGDAQLLFDAEKMLFERRPQPRASFAENVVQQLKMEKVVSVGTSVSRRSWAWASAMTGLAAALLVGVTQMSTWSTGEAARDSQVVAKNPSAGSSELTVAQTEPEKVTVPDAVREGTKAYLELMDQIGSTLASNDEKSAPTVGVSPLGRAVEGSSRTIRTAGEGLRVSVDPITSSAADAFGFLWRPAGTQENKPST